MESALWYLEYFMGVAWPTSTAILYLNPHSSVGGYLTSEYVQVKEYVDKGFSPFTLNHELSHYYWHSGPQWFSEGMASFLEVWIPIFTPSSDFLHLDVEGKAVRMEKNRSQWCGPDLLHCEEFKQWIQEGVDQCGRNGAANVHQWNEANDRLSREEIKQSPLGGCFYTLGQNFVLGMYDALGHEAATAALRELYLLYRDERRSVTEGDIYRAFLSNTPPGQERDFREVYLRVHGGPIPDP